MTHEDYERAANHWKIKDASDEKMDRDTLLKEIEQYIKSNNTCALATGSGEFVRVTPIEYTYHDGAFWMFSEGGEKFKALEKKLNHDLDRDLDYFSSDIKKMIATEIIKRYYYQRGNIIQQLKDDDGLKEAMKILNDPVKYKEMLSAPAAKE